jgi:hypothetical protein
VLPRFAAWGAGVARFYPRRQGRDHRDADARVRSGGIFLTVMVIVIVSLMAGKPAI